MSYIKAGKPNYEIISISFNVIKDGHLVYQISQGSNQFYL